MKTILVPFDFSPEAINALQSALNFRKKEKCLINVLHVIELPVVHDSVLMPVSTFEESLLEELRDKAVRTFSSLAARIKSEDVPQLQIAFGPIARVILTTIQRQEVDLVIMGTKGASGLQEVLVGSNTEKIVRSATAPVLVVRDVVDVHAIQNIVFPTNIDFESMEKLIQHVKALQYFFKAKLHLVRINTPSNFSGDATTLAKLQEFANRYMLADYTINVFNDGYEETGIIRFCHHVKADLLVMATHGRRGLSHLFSGSLTEDVVNHIDLPVWTFSLRTREATVLN